MSFLPESFFDLAGFAHRSLFEGVTYVWEALERIDEYLVHCLRSHEKGVQHGDHGSATGDDDALFHRAVAGVGGVHQDAWIGKDVLIEDDVVVEPGAMVQGPAIIGAGTVVRHGAYVRSSCIIGRGCVVGHATELKRVIMLDESQAPHFNYVGDSILGRRVNLGAGTKLSNLKNDGSPVEVKRDGIRIATGMRKLGAILGDGVQTGCNCVTSPGTLVGPGTMIYANAVLRGVYPPNSIVKLRQQTETAEIRVKAKSGDREDAR